MNDDGPQLPNPGRPAGATRPPRLTEIADGVFAYVQPDGAGA